MPQPHAKRRRTADPGDRRRSQQPTAGILEQRPLGLGTGPQLPAVHLRSVSFRPFLFRKMIDRVDSQARPGDLVAVFDRRGDLFGHGLYNPRSEIVVRMLNYDVTAPDEGFWQGRIEQS